jgi:uncharacterized membrane-anchored protein YitT (DUF2179 family)
MNVKKIKIHDTVKDYIVMVMGCMLFSIGAVLFVEPYGFAPGGTYGLAMVFHHLWGWRTEVAALCMDIPLLIIGTLVLGAKFGIKTLICTLLLPFFMFLVHTVYGFDALLDPGLTDFTQMNQQMLSSLFGGVFYGVGLGMVYRTGTTTGGTDIINMILRKYFHISMGTASIIVDGLITLTTVIAFSNWTLPMYSWVIIFVSAVLQDRVMQGAPSKTLMIITSKVDEVRDYIIEEMGRGATLIPGTGLYEGKQRDIIYVVVSSREVIQLRKLIAEVDPRAFINVINSSEILGEGFKSIHFQ